MLRIFSSLFILFATCGIIHAQGPNKSFLASPLQQMYNHIDAVQKTNIGKKPLIGISLGYNSKKNSVNTVYVESVLMNGGVPYLIPVTDDIEV